MILRSQFRNLVILILSVLLPAEGCIWGSVQYNRTLVKNVIKKIEPGKTTRKDLQKWLGPPEALVTKDSTISLPIVEAGQVKMKEVDSMDFFKHFSGKHTISEHHVVYYYLNEGEDINGFAIPIPGLSFVSIPATFGNLQFSELWVLVNRETEQVEDYVFLEREEKE